MGAENAPLAPRGQKARRPRLLVLASVHVDLTAFMDRVPDSGETRRGTSFTTGFGGKGSNQAVMAALLGAEVAVVACVGDDHFAEAAAQNLAGLGIPTAGVRFIPDVSTGVATIWVDALGQNRIVIVPGANHHMNTEQVDAAFERSATPDVVVCQLEVPLECVQRALELGRNVGAITVLNPAPVGPIPPELLRLATWLVPNEVELAGLLDLTNGGGSATDVERSIMWLSRELDTGVAVTLGERGSAVCENGLVKPHHVPAPRVPVVDTSGAGDAFVGAFAYALGHGASGRQAANFASHCASETVTRAGTQSAFRTLRRRLHEAARTFERGPQETIEEQALGG